MRTYALVGAAAVLVGCNVLLGLGDYTDCTPDVCADDGSLTDVATDTPVLGRQ
jgi:hypothetical protein